MDTIKFDRKNVRMTAHRGVSGLETENTAAAFIAAGQRSYFGVETDIHKTADGYFVCCHDSNLDRVSGEDIVIEETTLKELENVCLYEIGTKDKRGYLRVPMLSDYINICKKYGKFCIAEIKGLMTKEDIAEITAQFAKADMLSNTVFISFDFENLVLVRQLYPRQKVQYLTGKITDELIDLLVANKMDLDVHYTALDPQKIEVLHGFGIEVNCWTVNSAKDAEQLAAWGVDHITTNILE